MYYVCLAVFIFVSSPISFFLKSCFLSCVVVGSFVRPVETNFHLRTPSFPANSNNFFREIFFQFFSFSRCCHLSAETVSFHVQRLQNQSEVKFSFSFQNGSIQNDSNKNGLSLIAPLCIHFPADLRRYETFIIYRFFSYNNFFDFPFNL